MRPPRSRAVGRRAPIRRRVTAGVVVLAGVVAAIGCSDDESDVAASDAGATDATSAPSTSGARPVSPSSTAATTTTTLPLVLVSLEVSARIVDGGAAVAGASDVAGTDETTPAVECAAEPGDVLVRLDDPGSLIAALHLRSDPPGADQVVVSADVDGVVVTDARGSLELVGDAGVFVATSESGAVIEGAFRCG